MSTPAGQASQQIGMAADFRQRAQRAAAIFEAADEATGLPLSRVMATGPLIRLTETRYAQPAVVATSLAALLVLRDRFQELGLPGPGACAGHSVGELAAVVAAGALDVEPALRLVAQRSRLMAAACEQVDGTMAAVLGLDKTRVQELCCEATEATGTGLDFANDNAPGQAVVSGHRRAVEWLEQEAPRRGARRIIRLNVGGPFHSRYMRSAAMAFAAELAAVPLRCPGVPVVLNQMAHATRDSEDIRRELGAQIAATDSWKESLQAMQDLGCRLFLELGPGQVLTALVRRTLPEAGALSVNNTAGVDQAAAAVRELGD